MLKHAISLSLCGCLLAGSVLADEKEQAPKAEPGIAKQTPEETPTHKQVRIIKPQINGSNVSLHTFCLDQAGRLLCCVGGVHHTASVDAEGQINWKEDKQPAALLIYTPQGDQVGKIDLNFTPTAINVARDGTIYIAGEGQMAKLSPEGKLLAQKVTPNIGDLEEFKIKAIERAKKQAEEWAKQFEDQRAQMERQIAVLEMIPEADRTAIQKARLNAYARQKKMLDQQGEMLKRRAGLSDPDRIVAQAATVTGLAVSDGYVFVCTRGTEGHGYEVWRTDPDLGAGTRVLQGLSGCCGQLDIQAHGDRLLVAENGKFRVLVCDSEGSEVTSFGKRDRAAVDGFGSCCNPMNVRCCENGDVLAAESSIGNIKKFSADGKFLGLIGKAKIGLGCKHVAIGHDPRLDYYYMMNVDKGHICVLVPLASAPEMTQDELLAREARDGLGRKLVGVWKDSTAKPEKKKRSGLSAAFSTLLGGPDELDFDVSGPSITACEFLESGEVRILGGQYARYGMTWSWAPVRQEGEQLVFSLLGDGAEFAEFVAEFSAEDELTLSQKYQGATTSTMKFHRQKAVQETPAKAEEKANQAAPAAP